MGGSDTPFALNQQDSKLTSFILQCQDFSRRKAFTTFKSLKITAPGSHPDFQAGLPDSPGPIHRLRPRRHPGCASQPHIGFCLPKVLH